MNKRFTYFVTTKLPGLVQRSEEALISFNKKVAESVEMITREKPEAHTPIHEVLAWGAEEAMFHGQALWILKPLLDYVREEGRTEAEIVEFVTKTRDRYVEEMVGRLSGEAYVSNSGPWDHRSTSQGHNLSAAQGANARKYVIGHLSAALASFTKED